MGSEGTAWIHGRVGIDEEGRGWTVTLESVKRQTGAEFRTGDIHLSACHIDIEHNKNVSNIKSDITL